MTLTRRTSLVIERPAAAAVSLSAGRARHKIQNIQSNSRQPLFLCCGYAHTQWHVILIDYNNLFGSRLLLCILKGIPAAVATVKSRSPSESAAGEGDTRCQQPAWNVHRAFERGQLRYVVRAAKPFKCIYQRMIWYPLKVFSDASSGAFYK